jgi:hypothetical protein
MKRMSANWSRCARRLTLALSILTTSVGFTQVLSYPAPRFPNIPATVAQEDLLKAAKTFVTRKGGGLLPGYDIKPGQKVLLLSTPLYDHRIVDAVAQAVREAGASVDTFSGDVSDITGGDLGNRDWGYLENPIFLFIDSGAEYLNRLTVGGGVKPEEVPTLAAFKKYDLVISGLASTPRDLPFRWEEIPWQRADELMATALAGLPPEVLARMYELAWEQLKQGRKFRVTDPEGTDLSWTMPSYIAQIDKPPRFWREYMCMPERLRGNDIGSEHSLKGNRLESAKSMREVDVNGVVAGTINHVGAFAHIKIYIRHSRVERIEGGGRFGDEFRKILKRYENTNWPGDQPKPGFGWIEECGVGVIPSEIRPRGSMSFPGGTMRERRRAGVFHWAFGAQFSDDLKTAIEQQGLPDGHLDVHNNFGTMTLETADGKKIVFVDKGHMTVLDDPRLRELASHYGDPDTLLKEQWIPPVPGINVPGDYERDYARDPVSWINAEYERFAMKH